MLAERRLGGQRAEADGVDASQSHRVPLGQEEVEARSRARASTASGVESPRSGRRDQPRGRRRRAARRGRRAPLAAHRARRAAPARRRTRRARGTRPRRRPAASRRGASSTHSHGVAAELLARATPSSTSREHARPRERRVQRRRGPSSATRAMTGRPSASARSVVARLRDSASVSASRSSSAARRPRSRRAQRTDAVSTKRSSTPCGVRLHEVAAARPVLVRLEALRAAGVDGARRVEDAAGQVDVAERPVVHARRARARRASSGA